MQACRKTTQPSIGHLYTNSEAAQSPFRISLVPCLALACLIVGLGSGRAVADDFTWTGTCETSNWHGTCLTDPSSQCQWDPDKWLTRNNWGRMGCGSAPFPHAADDVTIGFDDVVMSQGDATIHNLILDGVLEVREDRTLTVNGDLVNTGILYPSGGSIWEGLVLINGALTNTATGYVEARHGGVLAVAGGSISNDGVIKLRTNTGMGHGRLHVADDLSISGSGELLCGADIYGDSATVLTNNAGHTIRYGYGAILVTLANHGTVNADRGEYYEISLEGGNGTNSGVMKASNSCCLDIYTGVDQSPGGLIMADGGTVRLRGATIVGGTLDSTDGSMIQTLGDTLNLVADITNLGYLKVPSDKSVLAVSGSTLTNNGTIEVCHDPAWGMPGKMRVDSDVTLEGSGELILGEDIYTENGSTLTNGTNHTIRYGFGAICVALINNGTVNADRDEWNRPLTLLDAAMTNNAVMKATNNGCLDISTTVNQSPNGRIIADGGTVRLRCATIVGGTLNSTNGGTIETSKREGSLCGTSCLMNVTNEGYLNVLNNDSLLVSSGDWLVNNGTVELWPNAECCRPGELRLDADLSLSGTGEVYCRSRIYSDTGRTLTNESGHTIRGKGKIDVPLINFGTIQADYLGAALVLSPNGTDVVNHGVLIADADRELLISKAAQFTQVAGEIVANGNVRVHGAPLNLQGGVLKGKGVVTGDVENVGATVEPGTSAGRLEIRAMPGSPATSDYTQGAAGTLLIELGGTTQDTEYDHLHVTGTATLDGELRIELIGAFVPQAGDQFTILTAGTVTGNFTTVSGPDGFDVTYADDSVMLTFQGGVSVDDGGNGNPVAPGDDAHAGGPPADNGPGNAAVTPPASLPSGDCGTGLCAAGTLPMMPLMLLGLGTLRARQSRRRVR